MPTPLLRLATAGLLLASLAALAQPGQPRYDDPPGRVARVAHVQGEASYSPAGESAWLEVVRNRPLVRGDRVWTERGALVELQVGSTAVRLGGDTGIEVLTLDDRLAQFELGEGSLSLRVARLYGGQSIEIATPTLALVIEQAGSYRIDVDPRSGGSTIVVREGAAEVWGDQASFPLHAGDAVRFHSADLRDHSISALPRTDGFDRYAIERDRRLARSPSLRYLGDDVLGYADLDDYGNWQSGARHGNVWFPSRVDAGWAPYRDGQWVWQEPWGWTWVDNAPWGFAPSHYGRWAHLSGRWGWIPGARDQRAIYAPALVAFVGGSRWSLTLSSGSAAPIGWFPLGPRDAYVPSYRASREYFSTINSHNTTISNTTIVNVYNTYSNGSMQYGQTEYANQQIAGAVTAVPGDVFVNSRSVRQEALAVDRAALGSGEILRVAAVAPTARSVLGPGQVARSKPTAEAFTRDVVARSPPPADTRPFAERERQLQRDPGQAPATRAAGGKPDRRASEQRDQVVGEQRERVNARDAGTRRSDAGADRPSRDTAVDASAPRIDRDAAAATSERTAQVERGRQAQQQAQAEQQERRNDQREQERQRNAAAERQQQGAAQQERQRQAGAAEQREASQREERRQAQASEQRRQGEAQQQREQADIAQQRERDSRQRADRELQRQAEGRQAAEHQQRQADAAERRQVEQQQERADDARQQTRRDAAAQQGQRGEPRDERGAGERDADEARHRKAEQDAQTDGSDDAEDGKRSDKDKGKGKGKDGPAGD